MKEWLKESHHQLAAAVWVFGLCCMYRAATVPIGIADRLQRPVQAIILVSAILAGPVGWGILKRQRWAKWVVFWIFVAMDAVQLPWAIAHRSALMIGMQLLAFWGTVRFFQWDITGQVEQDRRMEEIHEFLQQTAPPPLAPSSVTLEVNSIPPVTLESLAAAVESGLGRKCHVSKSNNSIDLGIETVYTTHETAVVGGYVSFIAGHLIVGAHPVTMEVVWVAEDGNGSPESLLSSSLTIGTPRQSRNDKSRIDGYDWTIPLAAALWTSNTKSATVNAECLSFESAEELLAWKTARLVSDNPSD